MLKKNGQRGQRINNSKSTQSLSTLKKKSRRTKDPDLAGVNEKFYHFRQNNSRSVSKKQPFVLDCLKVSESQKVLSIKDYNGLGDKHLQHFFMKHNRKRDLKKNGLIDSGGNIVPEFQLNRMNYTPSVQNTRSQNQLMAQLNDI